MAYRYYSQLLKKLKKTPALEIKNTRIRVPNYKSRAANTQLCQISFKSIITKSL